MTNKEILLKAFKKAHKNGWGANPDTYFDAMKSNIRRINGATDWVGRQICLAEIFKIDFAKAFWGEKEYKNNNGYIGKQCYQLPNWKYHLQQMALKEEPLKYLEKFLDE